MVGAIIDCGNNGAVSVGPAAEVSLEDAKAAAFADINARRWACQITMTRDGVTFDTSDVAATRLQAAIYARQFCHALPSNHPAYEAPTAKKRWQVNVDGTYLDMTLAEQQTLFIAGVAHVQACFNRATDLAALVRDADSSAEVAAIDLSTDWP